MSDAVFRRESAVEYFKELVDGALAHQGLAAQRAHGVLRRPAARRLPAAAGRETTTTTPLAFRLARALEERRRRSSARACKQIGDVSLFISGFFADSLRRKLVDVDYYVEHRRLRLQRAEPQRDRHVLAGLRGAGDEVRRFVDVLSEVSERTSCASNADLLRLYEKWLKTGSRRSGQLLVERGVVPNASIKTTRIQ